MKRRIAILGSTGSIGTQALDVIAARPEKLQAEILVAHTNADLLIAQAKKFEPNIVVIGDEALYNYVKKALSDTYIKVFAGQASVSDVVQLSNVDVVLTAMVGIAGLKPTMAALHAGKAIALANKETLVVAGAEIMKLAGEKRLPVIPVDSEHSAIFQCMNGERRAKIRHLILTASGGPFRGYSQKELENVSPADALKHPTWNMGKKVSIDSASMMNKGLEVIEAHWLFGVAADNIEVLVHPQSIVHSMVQFVDGSMKAQLGATDMRLPIQYALTWPERLETHVPDMHLEDMKRLDFHKPDMHAFRNLQIAYDAIKKGGNAPCIMNAANEIAVDGFLKHQISFTGMSELIETCLSQIKNIATPTLEQLFDGDKETRNFARALIKSKKL